MAYHTYPYCLRISVNFRFCDVTRQFMLVYLLSEYDNSLLTARILSRIQHRPIFTLNDSWHLIFGGQFRTLCWVYCTRTYYCLACRVRINQARSVGWYQLYCKGIIYKLFVNSGKQFVRPWCALDNYVTCVINNSSVMNIHYLIADTLFQHTISYECAWFLYS